MNLYIADRLREAERLVAVRRIAELEGENRRLRELANLVRVEADCIAELCDRLESERTGYTSIKTFRTTLAALRNGAKSQGAEAGAALAPEDR
jgi:hypothetical protein